MKYHYLMEILYITIIAIIILNLKYIVSVVDGLMVIPAIVSIFSLIILSIYNQINRNK